MAYPQEKTGALCARLVPGFDGVYDVKTGILTWRDPRPQPTSAQLQAEYDRMIAIAAAAEQDKDAVKLLVRQLRQFDWTQPLTAAQMQQAVKALARFVISTAGD